MMLPALFLISMPAWAQTPADPQALLHRLELQGPREAFERVLADALEGDAAAMAIAAALERCGGAKPAWVSGEKDERAFDALCEARRAAERREELRQKAIKAGDLAVGIGEREFKIESFPGKPEEPKKDGIVNTIEIGLAVFHAGRLTAPAFTARHTLEWKKGPLSGDVELEGASAGRGLSTYGLEASVSRDVGEKGAFLLAQASVERDEILGVDESHALRFGGGIEKIIGRHDITFSGAIGPNVERKANGETERFASPAIAFDYAFKASTGLKFNESLETEFNAKNRNDIEFKSTTSLLIDLAQHVALRLRHEIKLRTERVADLPTRRQITTLGLSFHG